MDSILVDEARTPLIISGMAEAPGSKYNKAARLAGVLSRDFHYTVDEKQKSILMTEEGYEAAEEVLEVCSLLSGPFACQSLHTGRLQPIC